MNGDRRCTCGHTLAGHLAEGCDDLADDPRTDLRGVVWSSPGSVVCGCRVMACDCAWFSPPPPA